MNNVTKAAQPRRVTPTSGDQWREENSGCFQSASGFGPNAAATIAAAGQIKIQAYPLIRPLRPALAERRQGDEVTAPLATLLRDTIANAPALTGSGPG